MEDYILSEYLRTGLYEYCGLMDMLQEEKEEEAEGEAEADDDYFRDPSFVLTDEEEEDDDIMSSDDPVRPYLPKRVTKKI